MTKLTTKQKNIIRPEWTKMQEFLQTPGYKIERRQFTATGGAEDPLNQSPLTSKYMPSYKYCVVNYADKDETIRTFRTRKDAQDWMSERLARYNEQFNLKII